MGLSTIWASIVGNQYCAVHLGIIMIRMVLSLMTGVALQRTECMPPIQSMYAYAVLLSVKIWTCLTLHLCLKYDFRANKMAFSPRTLIWFPSKELHLPPIGVFPSLAPHPCSLAFLWIVRLTGISCNDWFAFLSYFNHQCNSAIAEVFRGINGALYLPLLNLSEEILHLSNSL